MVQGRLILYLFIQFSQQSAVGVFIFLRFFAKKNIDCGRRLVAASGPHTQFFEMLYEATDYDERI